MGWTLWTTECGECEGYVKSLEQGCINEGIVCEACFLSTQYRNSFGIGMNRAIKCISISIFRWFQT